MEDAGERPARSGLHWIRWSKGKWHAWPYGGRRSLCGGRAYADLLSSPVHAVETSLSPFAAREACARCLRLTGPEQREDRSSASKGTYAEEWRGVLTARARGRRVVGAKENLDLLASRLAEVGSPSQEYPRNVGENVILVVAVPLRDRTLTLFPYVKAVVALLPGRESLVHVARAVERWREITGRDPRSERFRPDTVISTMLQVPTPEPYVRHLHSKGWSSLAQMWHPNTLEAAKKDPHLRGTFGGTPDYWARTQNDLVIVRE